MIDLTVDERNAVASWLARRAITLWPLDTDTWDAFRSAVCIAVMCELSGEPYSAPQRVVEGARSILRVTDDKGTGFTIGTIAGLAQVATLGLPDGEVVDHMMRRLQELDDPRWHCPHCRRAYPEDYGPSHCADCGTRLGRVRSPTASERERLA